MAITVLASGTQTVSALDTQYTLDNDTDGKTIVLAIDLANMVNDDVLKINIQTKILSGDTLQDAYEAIYAHVQGQPNVYSVPVPANIEHLVRIEQTDGGTTRAYKWALLALD